MELSYIRWPRSFKDSYGYANHSIITLHLSTMMKKEIRNAGTIGGEGALLGMLAMIHDPAE